MKKPSATSRWRQLEKRRKIKVWKAAEVVWRKALKLSIRAKCSGKGFTCRLQWNSLEHVWGGKSLDRAPEEELWHAAGPRLALSSPPNCTYCILVIVGGGTGLLKRKPHSAYWWLLYFITALNELNPRLGWKSCWRIIGSSNLPAEITVFLPHQCLDKSFFPTESYSSVQRLVWCPHFAFCCSNKSLAPLLSFQYCHFQQLGVMGGAWAIAIPGGISVSLP